MDATPDQIGAATDAPRTGLKMGPYALISGLAAAWVLVMVAGEWLTRDKG